MKPLFEDSKAPNGQWLQTQVGVKVFEYHCCSKKHRYFDPDVAAKCCAKEKSECRDLGHGWVERPLFAAS